MKDLSRRRFLAGASALGAMALASAAPAQQSRRRRPSRSCRPTATTRFPRAFKPRLVPNVNGLTVNMLEAGTQGRPLVLLLHGFPNLGYSWRKVMPAFADAGYYVIAPDCRGFGRTVGWDNSWDADPTPFLTLNMVRDQIALVYALGYRKAEMVVGHDQGQLIATVCRHHPARHVSPPDDGFLGWRRAAIVPVRRHGTKTRVHHRGTRRGVREAQSAAARLSGLLGQQAGR